MILSERVQVYEFTGNRLRFQKNVVNILLVVSEML